jgi:hypothetical protein
MCIAIGKRDDFSKETLLKGKDQYSDLLVQTSFDQLIFILKVFLPMLQNKLP